MSSPILSILTAADGDAQTVRRGYELNYKLLSLQLDNHVGSMPPEQSFLAVPLENIVVTAKKAEDDESLLLRFYEFAGKDTEVPLKLIHGARSASETDLMERKTAALSPRNGTVFVHARPYEIKTVTIVPAPLTIKNRLLL